MVCECEHDIRQVYSKILYAMYSQNKLKKYRILSRFPGSLGRTYSHKLARANKYETTQKRFFAALSQCSGLTFVDIGANVGEYTKLMAPHASRVVAFEPDPIAFNRLKVATSEFCNVELFQAAAGSSNNRIPLYRTNHFPKNPLPQTQASSLFTGSHIDRENFVEVPQIDIVAFLSDLNSEIGVIKIDAEGAEVPILEGIFDNQALLDRIRYIFAETHELLFPEFKSRYEKLHERAARIEKPCIDLYWH